jgi:DNA repair photolyase
LTRACLAVCAEFRQPVAIITKNHLVTRDADLLGELAKFQAASVCISLTTLDAGLAKELEPLASTPQRRLAAIAELRAAGVPVHVLTAPIIPGLNDHEIPALLAAAAEAGALGAGYTILRLPLAVAPIFEAWLDAHRPGHKEKVLGRIRELRGGQLNDPRFGSRMRGEGPLAAQISALFSIARRKAGLAGANSGTNRPDTELSAAAFRVPTAQMSLFGE